MSPRVAATPELGFVVPGWSVRAAFGVVAVALCLGLAQPGFWLGLALVLAAVSVAVPRLMTAWFLIGVLAFTVLLRDQSLADWRPYALIAGAHALHVLGSWMLVIGAGSAVQPAAFWPSARRFLLIQAPVQLLAVGGFALTAAVTGGSLPPFAVVSGAAIVALAIALVAPLAWRAQP